MKEEENTKSEVAKKEEEVLKFWQDNKIFEKSLEQTKGKKEFVFYDGPPFATGLPHYGHILASTIKDVIPRYKTMQGFHVPRRWGWDCHGLPIENIIEKELGFKHKKDIKEYGIEKFNEKCREQVLTYVHEWERIIPRMGRFVDMQHPYRTMDVSFMESVWWVFKQLWDKGLVYEDYRSMHICPRCETTLSQQEVSEGYKDVKDISVTVKFKIKGVDQGYFLAWTTTPWTLPGNVALAVGKDIVYVEAKVGDEILVLAKERLSVIEGEYEIVAEHKGSEMVGMEYEPPFDYYIKDTALKNHENGWKVYAADFVTAENGTGIAHEAPAFGADDWELLKKENLPFVQHVAMDGTIKSEVIDFAGLEVKPKSDDDKVRLGTDIAVLKYLQDHGTFFSKENITHTYPHCWRCDTPLLNYATSSWFVNVTKIKDNLLKNAETINWSPAHIKEGRFGKWLEGARDWSISRQRFWASAMPIWVNSEGKPQVIGSLEELKKYTKKSGNKYFVMRHGEAESNIKRIVSCIDTSMDPLTAAGRNGVEKAAKDLPKIDLIVCSPFLRTRETAEIIAKTIGYQNEIVVKEDLGEVKATAFDGKTWKERDSHYSTREEFFTKEVEGDENLMALKRRIGRVIYEIDEEYENKTVLIIGHGAPLGLLAYIEKGLNQEEILAIPYRKMEPAEIKELDFVPLPHNENYELDLHKPYIDEIELINEKGEALSRVNDVLDTWFDSASMPYGERHYPFENKEELENGYPAEFIAEGLDQTRAWFYYLHVMAGGLFDTPAFKNAIVNGIALAEDGKKMSKKLKNYPDPMMIMDRYGADSMRYYMLSSPIVKAEDLNFSEKGVEDVNKKIIGKLSNILSFYEMYKRDKLEKGEPTLLDQWIMFRLEELKHTVTQSLDLYELDRASRPILGFIEDLSVWYVRRSRERFKSDNIEISNTSLWYTAHVLKELSKVMAPFMPFFAEHLYLSLKAEGDPESVHLCEWSKAGKVDEEVLENMKEVRNIVSLALEKRMVANIKVRQPLKSLKVKSKKLEGKGEYLELIKDEINVKEIIFDENLAGEVELDTEITVELQKEGNVRELVRAIQDLRKQKNLSPQDPVILQVETDKEGESFVKEFEAEIKKPTNVNNIIFEANEGVELKIGSIVFKICLNHNS